MYIRKFFKQTSLSTYILCTVMICLYEVRTYHSLYFSSSSFNFSLYFFVLSLLELMIYAIIYTSYERDVIYFVSTWNILPTMHCS